MSASRSLKQRVLALSLCARLSLATVTVALAGALVAAWFGDTRGGLLLAAAIVLFAGAGAVLRLLLPAKQKTDTRNETERTHASG